MKIYTKTGDKGMTSLIGGKRVSKSSLRLESYGTIDELSSFIGLLITYVNDAGDISLLQTIQNDLFVVGGYLATDTDSNSSNDFVVSSEMIESIENAIDRIQLVVPPLRSFILPGGCRAASYAHVCRTICRRAERCICALENSGVSIDVNVSSYINRMSDYFFVLARKLNNENNVKDVEWKK